MILRIRLVVLGLLQIISIQSAAWASDIPSAAPPALSLPLERLDEPPGVPAPSPQGALAASPVVFGQFVSIQVNVNGSGANIVGDAANEPSIAVDPFDHNHIAMGWRQFGTIRSNFREAGFAYSTDGGMTWTAGKITPGVFRSDPVLGVDADGDFFYNSSTSDLTSQVFPSINHGMTWGPSVASYGGDHPWMTIDQTDGPGRNHFYEAWSTSGNAYFPNTFSRSSNDGVSFEAPIAISHSPVLGTLDVGPDGTLYVIGTDLPGGPFVFSRSTNAQNGLATPTFTTTSLDLGGAFTSGGPNPQGLLGQVWVAVDRSIGQPRSGWLYALASVQTSTDPLDVHFIRSTDGGATWSAPLRVNDDPTGTRAFQWFGTMSVSPDGRIDAVWNDTRGSSDSTRSALYYSYSTDGGTSWSVNEQVCPVWNSMLGFPKQSKIGDYYHMISDVNGADLAYAATFNGEQDIYYLRFTRPVLEVATQPTQGLRLHASQPNPFRSSTTIRFEVPAGGSRVKIEVLDAGGRRLATLIDGVRAGGVQAIRWNGLDGSGRPVAPGVYLCRCEASGRVETRRTVRVR